MPRGAGTRFRRPVTVPVGGYFVMFVDDYKHFYNAGNYRQVLNEYSTYE